MIFQREVIDYYWNK